MKVLVVEPNELPYEREMPDTLEAMQVTVDGLIQCTSLLKDPSVILICNEEGKVLNKPLNRDIGYDIIAGTFIIAGDDYENGGFKSLTEEQVKKYKKRFNGQSIKETENKIAAIMLKRSIENERDI